MALPDYVEVHDDWIEGSQLEKLIETVNWMPMYFANRSDRYDTHRLDIHWYYPVAVTEESLHGRAEDQMAALEEPVDTLRNAWETLCRKVGRKLGLYECMVSGNTFGTEGMPHHDFRNRKYAAAHRTALIYTCPKWDITWAGETLFFDENNEISGGVMPKPGRIVILRGDPYHVGRSVSRICPVDRRVVVFKYWDEDELKKLI